MPFYPRFLLPFFFGLILITGCKKDDDEPMVNPDLAQVKAYEPTEISIFSVNIHGELLHSNTEVTEMGFVIDTLPNPDLTKNLLRVSATPIDNEFTKNIKALFSGTKHYYRAYAINAFGPGYSNEISFTAQTDRHYPFSMHLDTQEEVIAFGSNHYTSASRITISGTVTDLTPLNDLVYTTSGFSIWMTTELKNLIGLENFEFTGTIFANGLDVTDNTNLESLEGLSKLTTFNGLLQIQNNDKLTNLRGLESLYLINLGGLHITDCDQLQNLDGLQHLEKMGSDLIISRNPKLTDISALGNLTNVYGDITLWDNDMLENTTGFENIIELEQLRIYKNELLHDLSGFRNVRILTWGLEIVENNSIENLSALESILSTPQLVIESNSNFTSLEGLHHLAAGITHIEIRANEDLSGFCDLKPALLLRNPDVYFVIGNKENPTIDEIKNGCP